MELRIDGRSIPLLLTVRPLSRRLTLRYDPMSDRLLVGCPPGVSAGEAMRFVRGQGAWIRLRLQALTPRIPFVAGEIIPILGAPHRLRHEPWGQKGVRVAGEDLVVTGDGAPFADRVRGWLKQRAKEECSVRAVSLAAAIGKKPGRIGVRDPRWRWGSCSAEGNLSFSWRLILAPEPVLAYVVAHEAAHLAEMSHSPRFWRVVRMLGGDASEAQRWLKTNGAALHRYG